MQAIICGMDRQRVPTYSTGNYIQYPVINYNGKTILKRIWYMYN